VAVADVLFISETYARVLAGTEKVFTDDAGFVGAVLKAIEEDMVPGASGHILLGARGSFCFGWNGGMDTVDTYATTSAKFVRCSTSFVATCEMSRLPEGEVVETVGAGDTFIAGVIWASLKGLHWMRANEVGSMVARKKCTKRGFSGLWSEISDGNLGSRGAEPWKRQIESAEKIAQSDLEWIGQETRHYEGI